MKKELSTVRNELNALIFHVKATPDKYITISQSTMLTFLLSIQIILEKEVFKKAESFDEMWEVENNANSD